MAPKAVDTLQAIANRARNRTLPNRHELVEAAALIGAEALGAEYCWTDKHGEERSRPAPNYQAANKSIEVCAAIALKTDPKAHDETDPLELRSFVEQVTRSGLAPMLLSELTKAMAQGGKPGLQ